MVHAAISGSTNATDAPARPSRTNSASRSMPDTFDRMHRGAHYLLNIRPSGRLARASTSTMPAACPRVMEEIRLHAAPRRNDGDWENARRKSGRGSGKERLLRALRRAAALKKLAHLIPQAAAQARTSSATFENAQAAQTAALPSSRATSPPRAAVIKHTACPKEMFQVTLRAKPYDSEEACIAAVLHGDVRPGDAVFIRYEGPQAAAGCPRCSIPARPSAADPALRFAA